MAYNIPICYTTSCYSPQRSRTIIINPPVQTVFVTHNPQPVFIYAPVQSPVGFAFRAGSQPNCSWKYY